MSYDARQIANWFIERSSREGRPLSIMSLLKLAYISHGWRLEMQNRPLFHNRIEAWQHGPVIPDVYKTLRPQGLVPKTIDGSYPPPTLSMPVFSRKSTRFTVTYHRSSFRNLPTFPGGRGKRRGSGAAGMRKFRTISSSRIISASGRAP
jgi:hypothetical protein